MRRRFLLALLLLTALARAAAQPVALSTAGAADYVFTPKSNPPLAVYYYVPPNATALSKVVFALHGVSRRAADVRDAWRVSADRYGFVVVTPLFDSAGYRSYNAGRVMTDNALHAVQDWGFNVIEEVFDDLTARLGLKANGYVMFGHSAGGQFVHRFAELMPESRAQRFVAANAGWYTYMDSSVRYPWGLGGLDFKPADECRAFARPLTILLGELDNDPNHYQLNRAPESMKQGANRLARGQNFFAASQVRARQLNCAFNWQLRTVQGAGHEFDRMGAAAAAIFFAPD